MFLTQCFPLIDVLHRLFFELHASLPGLCLGLGLLVALGGRVGELFAELYDVGLGFDVHDGGGEEVILFLAERVDKVDVVDGQLPILENELGALGADLSEGSAEVGFGGLGVGEFALKGGKFVGEGGEGGVVTLFVVFVFL